jgi:hypothetical protein
VEHAYPQIRQLAGDMMISLLFSSTDLTGRAIAISDLVDEEGDDGKTTEP